MADRDELKRAAAERALDFVESGMVLGLGTGSTAAFFVEALAARVGQGLVGDRHPDIGAHRGAGAAGSGFRSRALQSTGGSISRSTAPTRCSARPWI